MKLSLLLITFVFYNLNLFSQNKDELYTVKIKSNLFLGCKKKINFVYVSEKSEIIVEKKNINNKLRNEKFIRKFECDFILEVLEINEKNDYLKLQLTFNKALRSQDGEEKTMFFAIEKPYIYEIKDNIGILYFNNKEIKFSGILELINLMEIYSLPIEHIILLDSKIGEKKKANFDYFNINLNDNKNINEESSYIILKEIFQDEKLNDKLAKVQINKVVKLGNKELNDSKEIEFENIEIEKEMIINLRNMEKLQITTRSDINKHFEGLLPNYSTTNEVQGDIRNKVLTTIKILEIKK